MSERAIPSLPAGSAEHLEVVISQRQRDPDAFVRSETFDVVVRPVPKVGSQGAHEAGIARIVTGTRGYNRHP